MDTGTDALAEVRVGIAHLTGRIDQVILDHRNMIEENKRDIAEEKKTRSDEIRRLEVKFDAHSLTSEKERATLAANVQDLQNDSAEYRKGFENVWSRLNGVGQRILTGGAALVAILAFIYTIWSNR